MLKLNYYYGKEADQFSFVRLPKLLFTDPVYSKLTSEAKILYALMLDRMSLSIANGWLDKEDRVFIIFTIEDTTEFLRCGKDKAISITKELTEIGLIERKRRGLGLPSITYVLNFASADNGNNKGSTGRANSRIQEVGKTEFKKSEKQSSRIRNLRKQEVEKTDANNTNEIKNYKIQTNSISSTFPSVLPTEDSSSDRLNDGLKGKELIEFAIKKKIGYDALIQEPSYEAALPSILRILVEAQISNSPTVKIQGEEYPASAVKDVLSKVNSMDIEAVINNLNDIPEGTEIHNFRGYVRSMLYNQVVTGGISTVYATRLLNTQ